ncbi:FecR family protein [Sphingobacterium bovistauri]|uniref:FecR family protein n=1 Tax=Sphingobacterium bovistauri TaxID=2781959 RepID=A0ABS7Z7S9_9SPHI|nr:FecR family protein [Sphingobacterium bovistauri]MCA5006246.1 FecR family protein [Sphingobacterium bovistauri]
MPNKQRINYLFNQCLQQQETIAERGELNQYMMDASLKDIVEECMLEAFYTDKPKESLPIDTQDQILTAIYSSSTKTRNFTLSKTLWRWTSVAAVFLMISVPLIIKTDLHEKILQFSFINNGEKTSVENQTRVEDSLVNESATLEMVDGTKLYLPTLAIGTKISRNGLIVQKSAQNELLLKYELESLHTKIKNAHHTIKTPKGVKYKLTLPDGSIVHLNAASKLVLPYSFSDSSRNVELSGEAYFEVVKDKRRFTVFSQKAGIRQEVKVYGTSFNISAYSDDDSFTTTLVEGSVNVHNLNNKKVSWLKPNEIATYRPTGIEIGKADIDKNLAWINNIFYFEEEELDNVIKQISRWYDVEFKDVPDLPQQKLWAQVSRDIQLIDLLSIIEKTYAIKFKITGKEVYIVN